MITGKCDYVRRQGQTRAHTCHWPGCGRQVPPAMWGCREHWFKLPKPLRDAIWQEYRPGQEINGTPSARYIVVAKLIQGWIAGKVTVNRDSSIVVHEDLPMTPTTHTRPDHCPTCGAFPVDIPAPPTDALAPQSGKKGDGWIDVKERLPEKRDEYYLVAGRLSTGRYEVSYKHFSLNGYFDGTIPNHSHVAYWMPLPSPPSKAEGE